jgi:cell wall-associated NlpC family hydrolase
LASSVTPLASAPGALPSPAGTLGSITGALGSISSALTSASSQPTSRSVFAIAAASVAGAGMAAATMTGSFPAIPGVDHESHNIIDRGGSTLQLGLSAHEGHLERESVASAPFTSGPITGDSLSGSSSRASAGKATVIADDLHQSDAKEIAALSTHSYTPHSSRSSSSSSSVLGHSRSVSSRSGSKSIGSLGSSVSDVTDGLLGGSSTGVAALAKAMTKLGKPYVWGAKGPNAFDCSGLIQWAFKQVGVKLPGSTATQIHEGKLVSRGNLRPGDVVFFYHPVSHVGIYMGNGKVLHASEPGKPVKISKMNFPYNSARRFS